MALSKKDAAERQGGTPYIGRIPPGQERGGCKPQNQPNIERQPKGAGKKLAESAIAVAGHLGHDPKLWFYSKHGEFGQIMCLGCRKFAGFAVMPVIGAKPIEGWLVENRCGLAKE